MGAPGLPARPGNVPVGVVLGVRGRQGTVTVLAGEVQAWRDGGWRTVLTAAGYPVTDRRPGYVREQQDEGVLFGFDGTRDGRATIFDPHTGEVLDETNRGADFASAVTDAVAELRRVQDRIGEELWRTGGYRPGQTFDVPQRHDHVHVRRWT